MPQADPHYDMIGLLPAGQLVTPERLAALADAYADNDYQPLTAEQIEDAVGPAETEPTTLPRLPEWGCYV